VVDRCGDPRLAQEAAADRRILRERGGDDLERDGALQRQLPGSVDHPHPAAAGDRFDAVPGEHAARRHVAHGCGV
jgi:hypothetical protein